MTMQKHIDFRDQIRRNKIKSTIFLISIAVTIVILGYAISFAFDPGYTFFILALASVISIIYVTTTYFKSGEIAVASVKAKKASRQEFPDYHRLVEGLTIASGLPKPKLYVMKSPQINAFASGRDPRHAIVCVTTGALEKLDRRELEGVLAHEMSHIANYDIRFATMVSVMAGILVIASQIFLRSMWFRSGDRDNNNLQLIFMIIGIALAILSPIIVAIIQASISRKREFAADASAVKFTRNPQGLIGALEKIKQDNAPPEKKVSKAVAPLFFSNPFKNIGSTHPPIKKRIAVLKSM